MRIVMWHVTLPQSPGVQGNAVPLAMPEVPNERRGEAPDAEPRLVSLMRSRDALPAWLERLKEWAER